MNSLEEELQALLREEEELQFREFTNEMAYEIGSRLIEAAANKKQAVTVSIWKNHRQIFHFAMTGTKKDNDEWVLRKNRVVNQFERSSYYMGLYLKSINSTIRDKYLLDPAQYAPHGGAFPVRVRNVGVIGTITVSGLPQKEDHDLVVSVIREYLHKK